MEIVFVLHREQDDHFAETTRALAYEVDRAGVRATVAIGVFPPMATGVVYVLVAPRDQFSLVPHHGGLDDQALSRTILISADAPGSYRFDRNAAMAARCGTTFDISPYGVRALGARGVAARLLPLGYSEYLDHYQEGCSSDLDVLFLGRLSERRARQLARCGSVLAGLRSHIALTDHHWPRPGSVPGDDRYNLLRRSAVLLNIHEYDRPGFDWSSVVDAIHNGCVVVTDHAVDFNPLVPGEHFVSGRVEALPHLVAGLVEDSGQLASIRQQAYDFLRAELPLSNSVRLLIQAAEGLLRPGSLARPHDDGDASTAGVAEPSAAVDPVPPGSLPAMPDPAPQFEPVDPELAAVRSTLKEIRLDLIDLRRISDRNLLGSPVTIHRILSSPAYRTCRAPRVTVVTALYNHAGYVAEALDSLAASTFADWEVVIVDDGSTDDSHEAVTTWSESNPDVALLLLRHPVNRGLGHTRNAAVDFARGEYLFVLDSDNAVYPSGLARLVDLLDSDPGASFAYGPLAAFRNGEPSHLVSTFPWQPERLRSGNYIDAMAMFRTCAVRDLGAYSTDRRLYGVEDYDLYCRLAEHGHRGAFSPTPVARYRASDTSMLSLTDISHHALFVAVKEHAPTLMSGVTPPP